MMNLIPGWPGIVTLHIASENGIQNRNRKGSSPPNPSPRGRADKTQIGCNPPPTKPSCSAKQGFMNRAYTNLPPPTRRPSPPQCTPLLNSNPTQQQTSTQKNHLKTRDGGRENTVAAAVRMTLRSPSEVGPPHGPPLHPAHS